MKSCYIYFKTVLIAAIILCTSSLRAAEPDVISIGIVPQQNASKLAIIWRPILAHLTRQTGWKFQFKTAPSIPVFEQRVAEGRYDIAYMNPYHYTEFSKSPGYKAFAKAKNRSIRGIVVVRKDSEIYQLKDLDQQTIAFPAPAAFAATVLPRAKFAAEGIGITTRYVSSHDSVYLAVARGIYPGGGGVIRTLNAASPEARDQLKVLWTSPPYTSHPLAAHPRLSDTQIEKILDALVELENTEEGRLWLKALGWTGVEGAVDQQWDDVRGLGLELLSAVEE